MYKIDEKGAFLFSVSCYADKTRKKLDIEADFF